MEILIESGQRSAEIMIDASEDGGGAAAGRADAKTLRKIAAEMLNAAAAIESA